MIHTLLNLTRPLFTIDCETTGTDVQQDRIVSIGFEQWGPEGLVKEWKSLIDPGVPIPPAAAEVHGITDAIVRSCSVCGIDRTSHIYNEWDDVQKVTGTAHERHEFKPALTFKQLATNFAKGLSDCDFAGKNVRFDLRIIDAEMQRAGVPWSYAGARIVDAERLEQLAVPRTLSDLYEKYVHVECEKCGGEGFEAEFTRCLACGGTGWVKAKLEGAHDAMIDVRASTVIIARQLDVHRQLPRDLDELHAAQWPGWIDGDGKFRFVDGVPCFGMWGKYAGKPMRAADNGYWDWVIGAKFPEEIKKLARAAKLGKFPEAR